MKKVLFASVMALVVVACGQNTAKQTETTVPAAETVELTTIADLVSDPVAFGDQVVKIEGVIDHMCRHSGSKMRVKEDGSDLSIEVMLGDFASEFSVELEGKAIVIEGLLQYVVANKDELGEDAPKQEEGEEFDCESEKAAVEALKAKGIDPSISAFITVASYEIK